MRDTKRMVVVERAMELALAVYRLTSGFPQSERFGLSAQMRRAAVSVGSNIAEGCGRSGERDFIRFLQIARGSSTELAFQCALAKRIGYGASDEHERVAELIDHVQRMLNRLTCVVGQRIARSPDVTHAPPAQRN